METFKSSRSARKRSVGAVLGRVVFGVGLLAACAGCETMETPWVRGSITHRLPRLDRSFPPDAAFFVAPTEKRVKDAFAKALRQHGFTVTEKEEDCDVIVKVGVNAWEYNDVGFGGTGARDDMELSVALVDRRRGRVLGRSNISLRSDFRIFGKYVDELVDHP